VRKATVLHIFSVCNNTLKGFRGVIESPNFPNVYPTSVNCNWEIEVANRNKINISFSHFDLEKVIPYSTNNSNKCIYDFIEVSFHHILPTKAKNHSSGIIYNAGRRI
jgi:hypothetical protein